ncbi:hypothetical protein CGRA01v4_00553 [Colletotrichum graminicola]|nr:hypothetical protein CGRA01v4_00553 [Colletotrichum graminicola]
MPSHPAGLSPRNVTADLNHSRHHHDIFCWRFHARFRPSHPAGTLSEAVQLDTYTHTPAVLSQHP